VISPTRIGNNQRTLGSNSQAVALATARKCIFTGITGNLNHHIAPILSKQSQKLKPAPSSQILPSSSCKKQLISQWFPIWGEENIKLLRRKSAGNII
jgi:hypothetical protein